MIYTTEKMAFWLTRMAIPVQFTQQQGWQIYWQQTLTEDMDFEKNIGGFAKYKNTRFKNRRNRIKTLKLSKRKYGTMKTIAKKKDVKFAKGVSIIG